MRSKSNKYTTCASKPNMLKPCNPRPHSQKEKTNKKQWNIRAIDIEKLQIVLFTS
jgi:hypothetical protein